METKTESKRNIPLLLWLIISQLLVLISLPPWVTVFGLSFMAFDAGFNWQGALFVVLVGSYPPVALAAAVYAWLSYHRGAYLRAAISTSFPLVHPIVYFILILFV